MCAKVGKSFHTKEFDKMVWLKSHYTKVWATLCPITKTCSINWIYANGSINITVASFQQQLITTTYNVTVFMVDPNLLFLCWVDPKPVHFDKNVCIICARGFFFASWWWDKKKKPSPEIQTVIGVGIMDVMYRPLPHELSTFAPVYLLQQFSSR